MDKGRKENEINFQVKESRAELVCGILAIGVAVFILVMWLLHPSGRGGGVYLFAPLFFMASVGALLLVIFFHKKLIVNEMNICYVNSIGKEKHFTLDEIGYCKIGTNGKQDALVLYDLLGKKICKLGTDVRGFAQFHQYLVDNRVRVEWSRMRRNGQAVDWIDVIQRETAVCEEEIRKCSEKFYERMEPVFREWEKRNRKFDVYWEIGFAQYLADDLKKRSKPWERASSLKEPLTDIPESYECFLEAYLKYGEEYVVNSRGGEICLILPYLVRSKSYQIGEGTRIRKVDEESMEAWLAGQLEILARDLPRRRYHTENFVVRHKLSREAGLAADKSARSGKAVNRSGE